jgi:zinc transport system ATP-binding protein
MLPDKKTILSVKNLKVIINGIVVIKNITFDLNAGEILVIIGPNGAGKSVLLKTILGIIKKEEGDIVIAPGAKIGYLPQRFHIDTYLPITIKEFLNLKPNHGYSLKEICSLVEIPEDWLNKNLSSFSSGQLQKILLAWAIIDNPNLLLFDEPTENTDIVSQKSIYDLLKTLRDKLNISIIMVSHDLNMVYKYADNVLCLNAEMLCFGPPLKELNETIIKRLYKDHSLFKHKH